MSYDICPAIQLSFNDPTTGLPAAGGYVFFYEDVDRATLKPVYALSGSPGSYTWVPYEANVNGSISLDSSGSFNPQLYVYPYDEDGNVDKYYIDAYSSTGASIYQTENFPDVPLDDAQLTYLISSAGISPVDLNNPAQVAEAVENYVLSGDFFVDSSDVANIYVAERESPQGFVLPTQLVDGMKVRFIPSTTNTGASTFTIIETTNSIVGFRGSTTALTGGQIVEGQDLWLTYDLANTNWYICPNNADYVSAGNWYRDSGTANNYILTIPHNPVLSNPERLLDGAKVRFFPQHPNTGASTITFLGETHPVVNANPANSGTALTAGQIYGGSVGYEATYYLSTETWFLTQVPSSYSPVVIQKVFQSNDTNPTSGVTITSSSSSGTLFLTQAFTPKSTNSTINLSFSTTGGDTSGGGVAVNVMVGGIIYATTSCLASAASIGRYSMLAEGTYSNITGAPITVTVRFGNYLGGTASMGEGLVPKSVLTIEEII